MTKIAENSFISISLLIVIIGAVWAGANVAFKCEANGADIVELQQRMTLQEKMAADLAVIRTKVETIEKSLVNKGQ